MTTMKKSVIIFSALFLAVLSIGIVAAQALPAPTDAVSGVFGALKSLFTQGGYDGGLARFLIFMTVTIILYMPAYILTGRRSAAIGVSLAALVSYMGVRFLTNDAIIGLFLPSAALSVTIMTAIPFLLFSGVLEYYVTSKTIRKLGWVLMVCAFVGLWLSRWTSIGEVAYIYALFSLVSLAMLWFDGTIHSMFIQAKLGKGKTKQAWVVSAGVNKKMNYLLALLEEPNLTEEMRQGILGQIRELQQDMKDLSKQM